MKILEWPDKHVDEKYPVGADWSPLLGTDTISAVQAEVIDGNVNITDPLGTTFDGHVQTVWVSEGEPGVAVIECSIITSTGRQLTQRYRFGIYD